MKDVGTLSELGLKVGDVVVYGCVDREYWPARTISGLHDNGRFYHTELEWGGSVSMSDTGPWRIISRATSEPKLWRDMTAEEKGALLLAAHEGEQMQYKHNIDWQNCNEVFSVNYAYRIRPEPKVETVTQHWKTNKKGEFVPMNQYDVPHDPTHRITFTTIDGKPDCASVKMGAIE